MIIYELFTSSRNILFRCGFIQAKVLNETVGEIKKPKDVCFKFYDLYCLVAYCGERSLVTCA